MRKQGLRPEQIKSMVVPLTDVGERLREEKIWKQ